MNIFRSSGIAIGLLIGLLLSVCLIKMANSNHKSRTEYDERQRLIRGSSYKYAFYAMAIYEAAMVILYSMDLALPFPSYLTHFAAVLVGGTVLACCNIWQGAYWGLNNNRRRYAVIFLGVALLNAFPVVGALLSGTFITDGEFSTPIINLLVLVMLLFIVLTMLARSIADRREEE